MTRSPLIHIGYHKTGTTWFQQELFIKKSDIFFPVTPGKSAKYLGRYFFCNLDNQLLSPYKDNRNFILEEYDQILSSHDLGKRVPVISNERLSGNPHCGGFDSKAIAERIQSTFPSARIFCSIREQKSLILSSYLQYLRIGGVDSLECYISRAYDGRRPGFSPDYFRFVDLISQYRQLFGEDSVLVLPYELFRGDPADYFNRLGKFIGRNISWKNLNLSFVHNKGKKAKVEIRTRLLNLISKKSSVNSFSPLYLPGAYYAVNGSRRLCSFAVSRRSEARYNEKLKLKIHEMLNGMFEESNRQLSELIGMDLSCYEYHT